MPTLPIYLDNHATTRVDPRVLAAMLPCFTEQFGNAGSTTHSFGWEAKGVVDSARLSIAAALNAGPRDIIFTSGATESNNLAIRGICERTRRRGNHIVSVTTEHKAVLDPLKRLGKRGFDVQLLNVVPAGTSNAGWLDPQDVAAALRDDTCLVSVMLANNEIGVVQNIADIAAICRSKNVPLHCDATQAVGKIPVDIEQLGVDLLSFSAHKIYGPKGVGGLYVRRSNAAVRLEPLQDGGGQEFGLRSGTLNVPGIVGLAAALELCQEEMSAETLRLRKLRRQLWQTLRQLVPDVILNGPDFPTDLQHPDHERRLAGNLNCSFPQVDGEALIMGIRDVAVSSGSACTSANPEPSHVLRALGLNEDHTRSSLRFGIGRFNSAEEIEFAAERIAAVVHRLRKMASPG